MVGNRYTSIRISTLRGSNDHSQLRKRVSINSRLKDERKQSEDDMALIKRLMTADLIDNRLSGKEAVPHQSTKRATNYFTARD